MKKILIANRGEIAVRIIRTCQKMDIRTVAVYSEIDALALHTLMADEAYLIGGNAPVESYLNIQRIVDVALKSGADAVHPGFGFLSENSRFAKAVREADLIFIGPSEHAIDVMGNKLTAKAAVEHYSIPMVPGGGEALTEVIAAQELAEQIGFPVLIKAAAGGGGKGMRVVNKKEEFSESFERAKNEAGSAFNDDSVFLEKYISKPRHIEIQIIADQHGNICYLFERECSIQRRHQKVVEEAPSAIVNPDLRKRMGEAAVNVARACQYHSAGTVEFLVDEDLNFYFLEMNTRIQVEHPVTEAITGLDLVELQIKIAQGQRLPFSQEDLTIQGHAIELRVYAEDPYNQFLPDIGTLEKYIEPLGEGIRVDSGFRQGDEIPVYYDPMIAKLTVWAPNRAECVAKMKKAIRDYQVVGVRSTLPFGLFVMCHPAFVAGHFDTGFVPQFFTPEVLSAEDEMLGETAALIANKLYEMRNVPI